MCREIAPRIRDSIRPDGNCLYRAISKQVTGSQENHVALRLAVTQLMKSMLRPVKDVPSFVSTLNVGSSNGI